MEWQQIQHVEVYANEVSDLILTDGIRPVVTSYRIAMESSWCVAGLVSIVTFKRSLIIDDKSIPHKLQRLFTRLLIFKI